jgi:hypothetical protein
LLAPLYNRLSDLHAEIGGRFGAERLQAIQAQAESACAFADEVGRLTLPKLTFEEWVSTDAELRSGAEHVVEFDESLESVGKITVPVGFGVIPIVKRLALHPERDASIEYDSATPLEYLYRWSMANEIFRDRVELLSVIKWKDGKVSFSIKQPYYPGVKATHKEIEDGFRANGWEKRPSLNSLSIFYNYAYGILAFDAEPRNCYIDQDDLQPFDVVLCRPTPELEDLLDLWPD